MRHPGVEPTNNAVEQALRTVVLQHKISVRRAPCPGSRRQGLLGAGKLQPPRPRPAWLNETGAARLAGRRPGPTAAGRLSVAAALTSLPRLLCVVSWRAELAGMRGAEGVKEGG